METIKSKFDSTTVYKVAAESVTISKDGEDMKIPIRLIPKMIERFIPGIKAELQDIYEKNLPEEEKTPEQIPCAECGKLFMKRRAKKYCSDICSRKAAAKRNAERYRKAAEEKRANGVEIDCAYCGKSFVIYDGFNAKYCSAKCRAAVHREEKKSTYEKEKKRKISQCGEIEKEARKIGLHYADIQKQETLAMIGKIQL